MSKCNKVKNPCKICLGPVSQKTGLQCEGACDSWVHYGCLHYTPGRINDIRKGIIKVTCPCPDCKSIQPKEYRTDEAFSCDNSYCPANRPPRCENTTCPTNSDKEKASNNSASKPCPLGRCGAGCKQHSSPQVPSAPTPQYSPACVQHERKPLPPPTGRCVPDCPSDASNDSYIPGDLAVNTGRNDSVQVVEDMCKTVGQLTNQINELMCKMKELVGEKGPNQDGCYPSGNHKSCDKKGPKAQCPKPCYCPGNPAKKK
uniref:PHD-type domain-containing protein n=1 Tax=Bombyx mori TaxID=7091 RepID=A0A8R1WRP6_BOMMO|nr:uncharacterized protein LOC101738866 [Bombyx mori]